MLQETKRPSKEMQVTIARQLGLEPSTVGNFFMNARRRSMDKWKDDNESGAKMCGLAPGGTMVHVAQVPQQLLRDRRPRAPSAIARPPRVRPPGPPPAPASPRPHSTSKQPVRGAVVVARTPTHTTGHFRSQQTMLGQGGKVPANNDLSTFRIGH
ncbi:Homeobox protein onecut [Portunus trituberculatus]|uniref:Homeobox protein onecut n=1 Tax=Portunus trituberculatus TaxID=210409 RepID=A0A5B7I7P9_PORTR|nr:Homeobox protein onecut [Portunus trituberculatus]